MLGHLILAAITIIALFILFLIIARTINMMVNSLSRLEYLLQKDYKLKIDRLAALEEKRKQLAARDEKKIKITPAAPPEAS